jgi:alpha-beta hydrolase superfamily lysophospholipase
MSDINIETLHLKNLERNSKIYTQNYSKNNTNPKVQILLTHGLGEHCDSYRHFATFLTQRLPIKIYTWDLYGHGKSSGQRGYVGDIEWFIEDYKLVLDQLDKDLPTVTFSHSLGGLINCTAEQKHMALKSYNHVLSLYSNPCFRLKIKPPVWKEKGAEFLNILAPRLTLGNELNPESLSMDKDHLKKIAKDSLRHTKISPRLFTGMTQWMQSLEVHTQVPPTAALLSVKDSICDYTRAQFILSKGQFMLFNQSMHEILNDLHKEKAYHQVLEWIDEKI